MIIDGELDPVLTRPLQLLRDVLNDPVAADLIAVEESAWICWNHKATTLGGNPLARLTWSAMYVAAIAKVERELPVPATRQFPADIGRVEIAAGAYPQVLQNRAIAINLIAQYQPNIATATAVAFTGRVCCSTHPRGTEVDRRREWSCDDLVYGVALQRAAEGFYLEFDDFVAGDRLLSGPFACMEDIDDRIERFRHQSARIRPSGLA